MLNPLKLRREYLELTQEQLAGQAGVTRQVVVRAEQGLYHQPPASLITHLSLSSPDPRFGSLLVANYAIWVADKRASNSGLFNKVDLRIAKPGHAFTTLKHQVAGTSNMAFCRALVYQPSLIREFEKFGRGSASIFAALRQCGVEDDQIRILAGMI